jgi:hypothetical protein
MSTKQETNETNFIKEKNILGKIDALRFYIIQIENYITMFAEVNDQEHFVNTLQSIYVNTKNLYNELNDIRKEKMNSIFGKAKKCSSNDDENDERSEAGSVSPASEAAGGHRPFRHEKDENKREEVFSLK